MTCSSISNITGGKIIVNVIVATLTICIGDFKAIYGVIKLAPLYQSYPAPSE